MYQELIKPLFRFSTYIEASSVVGWVFRVPNLMNATNVANPKIEAAIGAQLTSGRTPTVATVISSESPGELGICI